MQVLVIGANFGNKGAQSMLFTVIATIRRYYPNSKIFFGHAAPYPCLNDNFSFDEVYYHSGLFKITKNQITLLQENISWYSPEKTFTAVTNSDLIIDVSGFALGSKWGTNISLSYINNIKIAKALNVPIILMPQSFGPFNFGSDQKIIDDVIKNNLDYPIKIFAREYDGYLPLRQKYNLKNVELHPDLVLSANSNFSNVFQKNFVVSVPKISSDESCVGIVPNLRSFDHSGNAWQTLQVFYEIINCLLRMNKRVYLFRHSVEDIYPCMWLKSLFMDDERVILLTNDFSCFEYDAFCKQFDFLVVGRFHGIVHAYKNNIPCIMIGWAVKYVELSRLMYQSQYVFDISTPNLDTRKVLAAIKDMDENLTSNKKILSDRLKAVQQSCTCFSVMLQAMKKFDKEASF